MESAVLKEMKQKGLLYHLGRLVFANEVGGIINPSNLRNRSLKTLLERTGLPRIRFHDLRHTAATLLLGKGVHANQPNGNSNDRRGRSLLPSFSAPQRVGKAPSP
jgi:integrase